MKGRRAATTTTTDNAQVGVASWYGAAFHGRLTASGERFDMGAMTAAHPTLPLATLVRVANLDNGRSITVRINDRGPYARGRIIDLSRAAARALDFETRGTARVSLTIVNTAVETAERHPGDPATAATPRPMTLRPRRRGAGRRRMDHRTHRRVRGRPAARPSYLGRGTARRVTAAAKTGRSR